jgi:hypothetical protein
VEEIRRGLRPAVPSPPTFEELAEAWLKFRASRKRSPIHDESILRRHLLPAFTGLRLNAITSEKVDELQARLGDLAPHTVHNILTLLIAMLNFAVHRRWLMEKPEIRKPRLKLFEKNFRYLRTEEEIRRSSTQHATRVSSYSFFTRAPSTPACAPASSGDSVGMTSTSRSA